MGEWLHLPVDMKDFRQPQSLKETLALVMDKMAARGMEIPILVDTQVFEEENPDLNIREVPIRFAQKSGTMPLGKFLDATMAQLPRATYLLRVNFNYIEITTSQRAWEESYLTGFGKQPDPVVIRGGLIDAKAGIAYLTAPRCGIDAVELATGKVLWSSQAVSRPLAVHGDRLVCFSPETLGNTLRLIVLDRRDKGKIIQESKPIALPGWVSVQSRWGQQFACYWWGEHKGDWYLTWEARCWWDLGREVREEPEAAAKKAAGIVRISRTLRLRPVDALPPELPAPPGLPWPKGIQGGKQKRVEAAQNLDSRDFGIDFMVGLETDDKALLLKKPLPNIGFTIVAGKKTYGLKVSLGPVREMDKKLVRAQHLQVIDEKTGRVLWERGLEPFFTGLYPMQMEPMQKNGLETLALTLKHKDRLVRAGAAESLGLLGFASRPAVKDLCSTLLTDPDPLVRGFVATALGRIKLEPSIAVPALAQALKDADSGVRFWAAGALSRFGRDSRLALPVLRQALKSKEDFVRLGAVRSLRWLGDAGVSALCEALRNKKSTYRSEYAQMINEIKTATRASYQTLLPFLWDPEREVRFHAAMALYRLDKERGLDPAMDVLCQLLADNDWEEGTTGFPNGPDLLEALQEIGPRARRAVPLLCQILQGQGVGAQALGMIGPGAKAAVPFLMNALQSKGEHERIWAALALWRISGKAKPSVEVLTKLIEVQNQKDSVLISVLLALGEIGPEGKAAVPALKKFLKDDLRWKRLAAAKALWRMGQHKEEALQTMIDRLKEGWNSTIDDLSQFGPDAKACLPFLKPILKSENVSLRLSAAVALCRIGGRYAEAIPVLTAALEGQSEPACQAAEYLGGLGPKAKAAVPALIRALDQDDFDLFQVAALALNKIDVEAAVKAGIGIHVKLPPKSLSRSEAASLWRDLIGEDPAKAYLAQWRLTETPGQTVALIGDFFPPVNLVPAQRLTALIENLKSDQFRVRQNANQELRLLGELAESALKKSLAGDKSLEFTRRVQRLLMDLLPDSPSRLRLIRTIQVLEFHDAPEARTLLEKLAKGVPQARQTQEARLALERLKKKMNP